MRDQFGPICSMCTYDWDVAADCCPKCDDQFSNVHDPVNHPTHYTSHPSGVETIEVTRHMGFNLGNAIKYVWRADLKGKAVEDLEKAIFYIQDEIVRRKKWDVK